jgi:hypothetical protein
MENDNTEFCNHSQAVGWKKLTCFLKNWVDSMPRGEVLSILSLEAKTPILAKNGRQHLT